MGTAGFMEKIYQGSLDESVFYSFQPYPESARVRNILEEYGKLLKAPSSPLPRWTRRGALLSLFSPV